MARLRNAILAAAFLLAGCGDQPPPSRAVRPPPFVETPPPPARPAARPVVEAPDAHKPEPPPAPKAAEAPPEPAAPEIPSLPGELLREFRERVLSLPAFYLQVAYSAEERARAERLAREGRGGAAEAEFLRGLLASPNLRAVEGERARIAEACVRLEEEAMGQLPVDRLVLRDGRALDGRIVEETEEAVRLERKTGGAGGVTPFRRDQVQSVQKGKGIGSEFKPRWEAARGGGLAERSAFAQWCREKGLAAGLKLVSFTILRGDPGDAKARADAELPADPVAAEKEAAAQGGWVAYEGKRWTAMALKERLLRDGYVIHEGRWHSRKERSLSVPPLLKYEKEDRRPVHIEYRGAVLVEEGDLHYKTSFAPSGTAKIADLRELVEKRNPRAFIALPMTVETSHERTETLPQVFTIHLKDKAAPPAGKALDGDVIVTVPLESAMLEGSVLVRAETKPGGTLVAYVAGKKGGRTRLFQAGAKEEAFHKLPPEVIRGQTQLTLILELSQNSAYTAVVDKKALSPGKRDSVRVIQRAVDVQHQRQIPDYKVVLFPADARTSEVFRLRVVVVGEPAEGLNKLFFSEPGAKGVLK